MKNASLWLDPSAARQANIQAALADLRPGLRVEALSAGEDAGKAIWCKEESR
ncbi:MAG: hypothetical protein AB1899_11720 [Pseudomonadota bacterium]